MSITDDYDVSHTEMDLDKVVSDLSEKVNQQLIKVIETTVTTVENYGK